MKLENYEVHLPNYSIGDKIYKNMVRYANPMEKRFW